MFVNRLGCPSMKRVWFPSGEGAEQKIRALEFEAKSMGLSVVREDNTPEYIDFDINEHIEDVCELVMRLREKHGITDLLLNVGSDPSMWEDEEENQYIQAYIRDHMEGLPRWDATKVNVQ